MLMFRDFVQYGKICNYQHLLVQVVEIWFPLYKWKK